MGKNSWGKGISKFKWFWQETDFCVGAGFVISPTLEVVKAFQSVITKEKEEVEVGAKTNIHFSSLHIWKNSTKCF